MMKAMAQWIDQRKNTFDWYKQVIASNGEDLA